MIPGFLKRRPENICPQGDIQDFSVTLAGLPLVTDDTVTNTKYRYNVSSRLDPTGDDCTC